ncbi:MAG: urease accessory protein UreD [Verrucomicrobiota bacterium]|nr:urease accessory protein UreD [Verrucomicrobiota bacterium]
MHLSKPHEDAGVLIVNAVNSTAGIFAGDRITIEVGVERGGRLLLTAPSATRVHAIPNGEARLEQTISVANGGFIELLPELFIPHRDARYAQKTSIELDEGARLLFFETLAPGRVASGEAFQFSQLDWETMIEYGGHLIAREKYLLSSVGDSLVPLRAVYPQSYYASIFAIGEEFMSCCEPICALEIDGVVAGCSSLIHGGVVAKILARDSPVLRSAIEKIRGIFYAAISQKPPMVRRT